MNKLKNNNGIALVLSLMVMMFLLTFGSILLLRVLTQKNYVDRQKDHSKSFYLAEAGVHAGLNRLDRLINAYLLNTINTADQGKLLQKINDDVARNQGVAFLVEYTKDFGTSQLTEQNGVAVHQGTLVSMNGGEYQYQIRIKQKGTPQLISSETWDFAYYFTIQSTATVKGTTQETSCAGDFTLRVQRVNFVKSMLFNNANFKNQNDNNSFVASSDDITNKITWQEGRL